MKQCQDEECQLRQRFRVIESCEVVLKEWNGVTSLWWLWFIRGKKQMI